MESIHKRRFRSSWIPIQAIVLKLSVCLIFRVIFTVGCEVEDYRFFIFLLVVGISPFLQQQIYHFKPELFVVMQPCGEHHCLLIFLICAYDLCRVRSRENVFNFLHVPYVSWICTWTLSPTLVIAWFWLQALHRSLLLSKFINKWPIIRSLHQPDYKFNYMLCIMRY